MANSNGRTGLTVKQLDVLAALERNRGNITKAVAAANVSRQSYYNWLDDSPAFVEATEEVKEGLLDMAEDKLLELIQAGNIIATLFFLKCKGKSRGYIETATVMPDREPDEITVIG